MISNGHDREQEENQGLAGHFRRGPPGRRTFSFAERARVFVAKR
jgi:hypothetical protein